MPCLTKSKVMNSALEVLTSIKSSPEGTPIEILTQLRAMHFGADTFDGMEGYIRYMQNTIRRMTEQPCELPESSTEERAAALIRVLSEIGALELLEE